ncbi:MAG TPA: exodeoxyribonuclease VII large subunit [Burkholderiales bacterium]|nr:exodeoxyribonuclease VII large subunit [Burkholderiales bacterium]
MFEDRELARESTGLPSGARGAILTVSALARSLRDLLEHRFPPVWVAGEISNFTLARSGHAYFVLKDEQSQIHCVMFRNRHQYLNWKPRDGMQVEAYALLGYYEARGEVQLTVETLRQAGQGALYERFLRLRDRLAAEGLFDAGRKRALPAWPRAIGIVTSPKAAALRDVLTTLARRNPAIPVVLYPAAVQGDGAAQQVCAAIERAGRRRDCDVLLLVRGGGSIEDLWAFNEEIVARAIRACPIAVVSGIGHETDYTIADFAADQRAPTPTAAAELVSPDREAVQRTLAGLLHRMRQRFDRDMHARMQRLDIAAHRLVHPGERIASQNAKLAHLRECLHRALENCMAESRWRLSRLLHRANANLPSSAALAADLEKLQRRMTTAAQTRQQAREVRLQRLSASLEHLNPRRVLERGYSIARTAEGAVITRASQVNAGQSLELMFAQGSALTRVERTEG